VNARTRRSRGGDPGFGNDAHTIAGTTTKTHFRPRLDEDADALLREGFRFLEASEHVLAAALLGDDHARLIDAAEHSVRLSTRATRCFSVALHVDLGQVA
jgi:hypothetical protein